MKKRFNYEDYIASVPGFPKEGILFRDITPLLQDGKAFNHALKDIAKFGKKLGADVILGPESRGFIFGCPVASKLGIGFVPVRKPGKLPRKTIEESYELEYGTNTLSIHEDALKPGQKVLIVDDLLATGGTVNAAIKLVERLGAKVVGCAFLIELVDLKGRENIGPNYPILALLEYEGE